MSPAVADVHAEQRGEAVEIALAVLVVDVASSPARGSHSDCSNADIA